MTVFRVEPRNVWPRIRNTFLRKNVGLCAIATGMWRALIQRSARHRMNSICIGVRCSVRTTAVVPSYSSRRSEEHTSELQSHVNLVCRLLLEKKKKKKKKV